MRTEAATRRHAREHRLEVAVALFLDGYLVPEIADEVGFHASTIESTLRARGYQPDRFSYDSATVDEWVARYTGDYDGEPWSINRIAEVYERSWSTVALRVAERVGRLRHRSKAAKLARRTKRKAH